MKVVILGAGVSGLAAARELSKRNEVTILDREEFTGGMASPYHINWDGNDYSIMKTYHHVLGRDASTLKFIKEMSLGSKLHWKKIKTGFVYRGKIYGFSTPIEILKFPIPFIDKIRLAKFLLVDMKRSDWSSLERTTAKEWVTKKAGELNYKLFFEKLARNKFQRPPDDISAAWLGGRLSKEADSARKKFGALYGGFGQITEALIRQCENLGVEIINGASGTKICNKGKKSVSYTKNGKQYTLAADVVINTLPPQIYMKLVEYLSPELRRVMEKINYLSVICVCVGTKLRSRGYYWLNVLDENLPFSVLFESTALYEDAAPQGKSVYYIATYLPKSDPLWKKTDQDIIDLYLNSTNKFIPGFSENVEWIRITRFENAEAVYYQNFENPPIKADGVYFAGIYRIYPKTRDIASPIESGIEAAQRILRDLEENNLG